MALWKTIFPQTWGREDGFKTIQVFYIQAHLPLCDLVRNRPRLVLVCSLEFGDPCAKAPAGCLVARLPRPLFPPKYCHQYNSHHYDSPSQCQVHKKGNVIPQPCLLQGRQRGYWSPAAEKGLPHGREVSVAAILRGDYCFR